MGWFEKGKSKLDASEKKTLGEGVFRKCNGCGATPRAEAFAELLEVCPECGFHYPLGTEEWIDLLLDEGSFQEEHESLVASDPLKFVDSKPYADRVRASVKKAGVNESVRVGGGKLNSRDVQFGIFVFRFMGGSMGSVAGEKIARLFEKGADLRQPVILLSASGGARMQEGILSLMQMAKTVSALGRLRAAEVPFVSVLLNPTTGGVAASFSLLGDVNIAEPNALIGFAGPRVIENTIREKLPAGFQRSEFLVDHGMVDMISPRAEMRPMISRLLGLLCD